jgi:hypothetical protein
MRAPPGLSRFREGLTNSSPEDVEPGLATYAAVSEPIFKPDVSDAENQAALENVVRFFSILLEWEAASATKLHNAHCNAEAP